MSELERRTLLGAAGLGAIAAMSKAGPLNPPAGPVAGTGRTLDEVYDRIPVVGAADGRIPIGGGSSSSTRVISSPGSYVLTGNLSSSAHAATLMLAAQNITLDLNGFTVSNTADNTGNPGIAIGLDQSQITVRNGRVLSNFGYGVQTVNLFRSSLLLEDLRVESYGIAGISLQTFGATVRRCRIDAPVASPPAANPRGLFVIGSLCLLDECCVTCSSIPMSTFRAIDVTGNGHTVSRCTALCGTAGGGGLGLRLDGQIAYRDNTVVNFGTPYSGTNGAGSGGGNV
ncbi:MAG: hypothetical protein QM783_17315 [Phycisphaerales bacterium]